MNRGILVGPSGSNPEWSGSYLPLNRRSSGLPFSEFLAYGVGEIGVAEKLGFGQDIDRSDQHGESSSSERECQRMS